MRTSSPGYPLVQLDRADCDDEVDQVDIVDQMEAPLHSHGQYDTRPLLDAADRASEAGGQGKPDRWAVACLLLQHLSSTFTAACYDFASFLFLIEVFEDTLVPSSLVGLSTKLTGFLLSGYVGGLVDRAPRLRLVRLSVAAEKSFKFANYALFLVLFGPLLPSAQAAFHGQASPLAVAGTWVILLLTVVFSSCLGLANTALTVAIERDWVMTIARDDGEILTLLNTNIRRIDLLSKLIAPLFVSILTTANGYTFTTLFLLAWVVVTCATEYFWIEIVYRRFPILAEDEDRQACSPATSGGFSSGGGNWMTGLAEWWNMERADWTEFSKLPIFWNGTFISYVKVARGWDDRFVAIMRGLCVVTGLIGTWVMPRLESWIGLERSGAWSIWSEIACLAPTTLAFFYGAGKYGTHGETWNSVLLFGGIALSRIGLWSFDLCQLKQLQLALDVHPRRNTFTALQLSLSNLFDLTKYALTLAVSTPKQFKWTALVSWIAVLAGGLSYAIYLRMVRGHLVHVDWLKKAR